MSTPNNMFWASGLLSFLLRFEHEHMFIEFAPELRAPLVRASFQFNSPYQPVFAIPAIALGAGLASGLTFP
jgi:hypothetical protein